eukprot:SAG31_NODE_41624_length_275_cov_0.590909_1_plen_75_part_01
MASIGSWNFDGNYSLSVEPEYLNRIADAEALADCRLSLSEISSNDEASRLSTMIAASVCAKMNCRDPSSIQIGAF